MQNYDAGREKMKLRIIGIIGTLVTNKMMIHLH